MKSKVSMDDIAQALNISRNTVSKAFNDQPMREKTKQLILNKAIEMGYKNLDVVSKRETVLHYKNILILTSNDIQNLNFFLAVLRGIDNIVNKYDLNLFQYKFDSPEKIDDLERFIVSQKISGILALETFNSEIVKQILSLKVPSVFLDSTVNFIEQPGNYDIVLMENRNSVKVMVRNIIKSSRISKIGFVGDYNHCLSFYERFSGFKEALFESRIHYSSKYNITKPDEFPYGNVDELAKELQELEELPELFVCANDFLAISIINSLKKLGKRVPQDIQVMGFDNTVDARNYEIPLTTIDTDKEVLGNESIVTLLSRVKYKEDRNRIIYLKTSPIYRESTK